MKSGAEEQLILHAPNQGNNYERLKTTRKKYADKKEQNQIIPSHRKKSVN